jgi:site-specific DNA recombinase
LIGILEYMQDRVFGPKRRELLDADQEELDRSGLEDRQARIGALRGSLEEVVTRQERQILALEREDDPNGLIYRRIRERIVDLEAKRERIQQELKELTQPLPDDVGDPDLLEWIPLINERLSEVPEPLLRRLLEAVRLSLRVNKLTGQVLIELVIDEVGAQTLSGFSTNAFSAPNGKQKATATHNLGRRLRITGEFAVGGRHKRL